MKRQLRIMIYGSVQGVSFRAMSQRRAAELNIVGFVKNERDGSVLIEAEGDDDDLEQLIQWCQEGPLGAVVESVEVSEAPHPKAYSQFEIRY